MDIDFDRKYVDRLDQVLGCYPSYEFQSPTRSTVPLVSLLKDARAMKSLLQTLGFSDESLSAHLEFKVGPPKGKGEESHTDLMLIQKGSSIAIEAKWTEPPYSTVDEWICAGSHPLNRCEVLRRGLIICKSIQTERSN